MDLTILKQTVEDYSQDSDSGEATLSLEILKRHIQDATKFKSTDSISEDSDSTPDLAALLMAKLSGDSSYTDGGSAISDSDTASTYDNSDSTSIVDQLKSKLSQIDYSVLTNLPEFSQAMEGSSADQLPAMAKQFIRDKVAEANPGLLTEVDTITASLNSKLQTAKSSSDVAQIRSEFKLQMNALVEKVLNSAPTETTAAPMMTSTNPADADSTDEETNTLTSTPSPSLLGTSDSTSDGSGNGSVNYAGSSNQYANMFSSGDTNISIVYQCLLLFANMSANEINMLLVDAQLTTANTNATDAINQAISAFSSLSEVTCPYVTPSTTTTSSVAPTPNPAYVSNSSNTANASGVLVDSNGNPQYLNTVITGSGSTTEYTVTTPGTTLYDLGAVFNYAYNPANEGNSDISNLQYNLSGLYDQLSAFDPDFAANVASTNKSSTTDFDETEFTDTFSNYVDQLNNDISSIDPTLTQLDMLPTSTVYDTSDNASTVIDWGASTTSVYTKPTSGSGAGTVTNTYASESTKTNLTAYTTGALSTAKTSGSVVSTTLSTQTQYDMSIYTQYTEAMLSFVSTQSTINQRMWS